METRASSPLQPLSRQWIAALLIVLSLGIAARVVMLSQKVLLEDDEAATYLTVTGHQDDFARAVQAAAPPVAVWVETRDWQRLLSMDETFILGDIRAVPAHHYDRHPPLYFLILHLWMVIAGVTASSGAALNVVFDGLTFFALLALAARVLRDRWLALLVATIWLFSPASIITLLMARPYSLLSLLGVLFAYELAVTLYTPHERPRWRWVAVLTLTIAAGMLTAYIFAYVLVAGGVALLVRWAFRDRRPVMILIGAGAVALLLFVAVFPDFANTLWSDPSQALSGSERALRLAHIEEWPLTLLLDDVLVRHIPRALRLAAVVAGAAAAGWAAASAVRQAGGPRRVWSRFRQGDDAVYAHLYLPIIVIVLFIVQAGAYLTPFVPQHASAPRYLALVGVFWAFVPVLVILPFRARMTRFAWIALLALVAAGMLLSGLATTAIQVRGFWRDADEIPSGGRPVLIDSVERLELLPIVFALPPGTRVFAASPDYLLDHPDDWLPTLEQAPALYVRIHGDDTAIIDLIRAHDLAARERLLFRKHGFEIAPPGQTDTPPVMSSIPASRTP